MKSGELVTPTGVLVMGAEAMGDNHAGWLEARRWRAPRHLGRLALHRVSAETYRRHGLRIGSSDVPSILDLDGVDTPAHVFRDKMWDITRPANEAMGWGHIFEGPIADEWCRRNRAVIDEIGLVAHADKPWHQSTIDRRVRRCPVYGEFDRACGLEVKNVGFASASRWHAEIPDRILAQIVHQLFVTGYEHIHYACNVGGNTMKQGIVYADRERELMDFIVSEVDRFRADHLLTGVEPAWDTTAKAAKLIELDTASHPERVGELTVEEVGAVMEYAEASAEASAAKKRQEAARARLAQLADGAQYVKFADHLAYSYTPTTRTSVDLDALKERHPAAYDDTEVVATKTSYTLKLDKSYKVGGR